MRDLDFKSMRNLSKGLQSLTKLYVKQAAYMSGSFSSLNIYDFGRNSSFVIQELIMLYFYVFSKDKSLKL
jgi:hypothetical protein